MIAGSIAERKLDSLRRCLERVRCRCPDSAEALVVDVDAQDIVSLNLTRAVQRCVDIGAQLLAGSAGAPPQTMAQTFIRLAQEGIISTELAERLRGAVGFRNIAIHEYDEIDWHIVYAIATRNLTDFEDFARAALACLGGSTQP